MSESKIEKYKLLVKQIESIIDVKLPSISNLSNITAAIKQSFSDVSWVGFYLLKNEYLYLGPFQGKVACTKILLGEGVCGTAAKNLQTQIVPNVHEFPGHIACDVESNSEIVVPLLNDQEVLGVLDLDSTSFSAFDENDKKYLEEICIFVTKKIDLKNLIM